MRRELANPIADEVSLSRVASLAKEAYLLHEHGQNTAETIEAIASIAKKPFVEVSRILQGAFGSVRADSFAQRVLVDWSAVPDDLSELEMLELVERICAPEAGQEFLTEYWLRCLQINTGNARVSDLIYWPDQYFGSSSPSGELSPVQILQTALRDGFR